MQTWNPDCGKKTKFIYHPRARRTDAEPVMHKVNSLVIIGSFLFQYTIRACPVQRGKKKTVGLSRWLFAPIFEPAAFEKIKAAGSFCLSKRFIVRMAAARRMPLCAWCRKGQRCMGAAAPHSLQLCGHHRDSKRTSFADTWCVGEYKKRRSCELRPLWCRYLANKKWRMPFDS